MELTGVSKVNTFDDEEIILETSMGYLNIVGQEMHISMLNLDEGRLMIEGSITGIEYKAQGSDLKTKGKSILNRLIK
jgi:sporulation protein YabP